MKKTLIKNLEQILQKIKWKTVHIFWKRLPKHASLKQKTVRMNHAPYVMKALRKNITKRSNLQKIYFKKKTPESLKLSKKKKNYCSKLYKKERKRFSVI